MNSLNKFKKSIETLLIIIYAVSFILNIVLAVKNKNVQNFVTSIWIINATLMFSQYKRANERADYLSDCIWEMRLEDLEKNIKELKNEQGTKDEIE